MRFSSIPTIATTIATATAMLLQVRRKKLLISPGAKHDVGIISIRSVFASGSTPARPVAGIRPVLHVGRAGWIDLRYELCCLDIYFLCSCSMSIGLSMNVSE